MKLSERWLREWFDPGVDRAALAERLTLAGLEIDGMAPAGPALPGVLVAEVRTTARHPDADTLSVCTVFDGQASHQVVCGAANVRPGLKTAYAPPGATIGDGRVLTETTIRGVGSRGMLCSMAELGLGDDAEGIVELPADAHPGDGLHAALVLDDTVLEINLTPNRGDCLSVLGVARDLAALHDHCVRSPNVPPVAPASDATVEVRLDAPASCASYAGRVITGLDPRARTPLWMAEKLRRSGVRCIHPLVDVTNFVMLELGQPMHAFDLAKLSAPVVVREASAGESIVLLDGNALELESGSLLITDASGPVALAGIMGGASTAVSEGTTAVFLESAYFDPIRLAGAARRYKLHTDASQRFERGVDPSGQARAVERATALILDICGGTPGPCVVTRVAAAERPPVRIAFHPAKVERLLGVAVDERRIVAILRNLGMQVDDGRLPWQVDVPPCRFDITLEADLVEEVARVNGYEHIPVRLPLTAGRPASIDAASRRDSRTRGVLAARGYFEAITYSFIEPSLARAFEPGTESLALANPISSEMSLMRRSLWPGLVQAALHNRNRQVDDIRLFEIGMVFQGSGADLRQFDQLAGVRTGAARRQHWLENARDCDFFDIKQDVEAVLQILGQHRVEFAPATHAALHPGQCAALVQDGRTLGHAGMLHPALGARLGFDKPLFLFEIVADVDGEAPVAQFQPISRFPAVRRDLAVVVDEAVRAADCLAVAREAAGALLRDLELFDVYRGQGIDSGKKSLALGLIFQALSSTLTDDEVEQAVRRVLTQLRERLGGTLRD